MGTGKGKYARKADDTGKGINSGYVIINALQNGELYGEMYFETEKGLINHLRKENYEIGDGIYAKDIKDDNELLNLAGPYDDDDETGADIYYYTDWDYDDDDKGYWDRSGKFYKWKVGEDRDNDIAGNKKLAKKLPKYITYSDGYKFLQVSENYARKNWMNEEIFGLDIKSQKESLIQDLSDLNRYSLFGKEITKNKKNMPTRKITGYKKGRTKFVEKREKSPNKRKHYVRVERKDNGQYDRFKSIGKSKPVDDVKRLTQIASKTKDKLTKKVIAMIKSQYSGSGYDSLESWMRQLLEIGCESGMVSDLIYYSDTLKFFKTYNQEIVKLLKEVMWEMGAKTPQEVFGKKWDDDDPFASDTTNQNLLAWFAFEETNRNLYNTLGYEY